MLNLMTSSTLVVFRLSMHILSIFSCRFLWKCNCGWNANDERGRGEKCRKITVNILKSVFIEIVIKGGPSCIALWKGWKFLSEHGKPPTTCFEAFKWTLKMEFEKRIKENLPTSPPLLPLFSCGFIWNWISIKPRQTADFFKETFLLHYSKQISHVDCIWCCGFSTFPSLALLNILRKILYYYLLSTIGTRMYTNKARGRECEGENGIMQIRLMEAVTSALLKDFSSFRGEVFYWISIETILRQFKVCLLECEWGAKKTKKFIKVQCP